MKAKEIWIAVHPDNPDIFEVKMHGPCDEGTELCSIQDGSSVWVEWVRYAAIPMKD